MGTLEREDAEALTSVAANSDADVAPVIPSSPIYVHSTRKTMESTPVAANPTPVLVSGTPA
jgi:hypothetical protein